MNLVEFIFSSLFIVRVPEFDVVKYVPSSSFLRSGQIIFSRIVSVRGRELEFQLPLQGRTPASALH